MKKYALGAGALLLVGCIVLPHMASAKADENYPTTVVDTRALSIVEEPKLVVQQGKPIIEVTEVDVSDTQTVVDTTEVVISEPTSMVEAKEVKVEKPKPVVEQYDNSSDSYNYNSGGHLTRSGGVYYYGDHKETWYSTNEPGQTVTAISIPGKHAGSDGVIRDADGYICVATNQDFHKFGEVIETSLGLAKVYDCGCRYGTVDIYTTW